MIYLLAQKTRGAIVISSMTFFSDLDSLKEHVKRIAYGKSLYFAYELSEGQEGGVLLSNKKLKEIGLRD